MDDGEKARIFISHTSADKQFARELSRQLHLFGYSVWFDEWEIAVGESIVDRVFDGLRASDTLIVILSPSSVVSRWVKEELSVAVMRRISERDIRVLPVLIETCDIPTPLKHIRYADFRESQQEGMSLLLESLSPGHVLWKSLSQHYDHFCLLVERLRGKELNEDSANDLTRLHDLLDAALNLRTEIELRRARERIRDLNFFEKIGFLVEKGVDVRSQTWNALVHFRASLAHDFKGSTYHLKVFADMLRARHDITDLSEVLTLGLDHLTHVMVLICSERWGPKAMEKTAPWEPQKNAERT